MNFHWKKYYNGLLLAVWMVVGTTSLSGQWADATLARSLVLRSEACLETENWDSARFYSMQAAGLYEGIAAWESWVDAVIVEAECLGKANRPEENRGMLDAALAKGVALWGEENVRVANLYETLGAWHFGKAKVSDSAIFYLQKGLKVRIAALGRNQPDVAASMELLGDMYQEFSIFEPSLASYMDALQVHRALETPDSLKLADCHDKIANALWYIPDYEEAYRHLLLAKEIRTAKLSAGHPLLCESESNLGHILHSMGKPKLALKHHQNALALAREVYGDFHPIVARSYNGIAKIKLTMGDINAAVAGFKLAFDIRIKTLGPPHRLVAESAVNLAISLTHAGKYETALEYLEIAPPIWIAHYGNTTSELSYYYNQKAILLHFLGDLEGALESYTEMRKIILANWPEGHPDLAICHSNMGSTLLELGDYDRAQEHLQIAVNMGEEVLGEDHFKLAGFYNGLGKGWSLLENTEMAKQSFEKAIEMTLKNYSADNLLVAEANENLGALTLRKGEYTLALKYFDQAKTVYLKHFGFDHIQVMRIIGKQGNAYQALGDFSAAKIHFEKSLRLAQNRFGKEHFMVALSAGNLAKLLVENGQVAEGLVVLTQAIDASYLDEDLTDIYQQPSLRSLTGKTYLLKNLKTKAEALLAWDHPDQQKNLEAAYLTYCTGVNLIDTIRISYSRSSKIRLSKVARPFYEGGIRLALQLFEQKEDRGYLETAFRLMEKSRSTLLLETLQDGKAKLAAHIPDSLLAEENQIKVKLASLERQKVEAESKANISPERIKNFQERILNEKQKLRALINTFKKNHGQYYQEKYALQTVDISQVQNNLLGDNSALVEYFYGDSNIYAFTITADEFHLQALPNDSATLALVEVFVQTTTDADYVENIAVDNLGKYQKFTENGHQLYKKLAAPVLDQLSSRPSRLILIPDGPLSNIPFDALLTAPTFAGDRVDYEGLPYLINEFTTQYAWSATVLSEGLDAQTTPSEATPAIEILAFAPPYELWQESASPMDSAQTASNSRASEARGGIPEPLPFAKEEVQALGYLFDANIHHDTSATEANFHQWAPQAHILHIAAHGVLDAAHPEYSNIPMLYSAEDSGATDGRLYISEISNMHLQAELAVLPVCHSNAGSHQSGEGIMSLSRAFAYAGVPNVIASQWGVDDRIGKEISMMLYKHLSEGKTMAKALQLAKIDGRKYAGSDKAHPYYWASMVLIGHDKPIEIHAVKRIGPVRRWAVTASAVAFSLLLGAGLFWRRRRRFFL